MGALLSFVTAFFSFAPFLISPSRASLPCIADFGTLAAGAIGGGGGGGGADIVQSVLFYLYKLVLFFKLIITCRIEIISKVYTI